MQKTFIKRLKKQEEDALEYIIDECINDVFFEVWIK